jgi:predicted nucleotidyltransferase
VLTQCSRLTRGKQLDLVPLEAAIELPSRGPDPYRAAEQSELRTRVSAEVQALPENERMVTTLFYISEYSLKEIGAFLELPVTTIKKRLWSARQKLRHKMLDMVRDTLQEKRPSRDGRFAETVARYNEALESLVGKLKQDRYVLAAILRGSLSHDQVWEKSDIDLLIVGREEKKPDKELYLVENGINIHALLVPRSKFKAMIETLLHNEVTAREVIHQALRHNPAFFNAIYTDLIDGKKDAETIEAALRRINGYLDEQLYTLFRPILRFLAEEGGIRSTADLDAYFGPKVQTATLAGAYEWLADRGVIQKVSAPLLLTEKSRVFVDEAAYYYDGGDRA